MEWQQIKNKNKKYKKNNERLQKPPTRFRAIIDNIRQKNQIICSKFKFCSKLLISITSDGRHGKKKEETIKNSLNRLRFSQ